MRFINKNKGILLPLMTFLLLVLLIVSFLIPKKVIDTYKVNISEEEGDAEYLLPLEADHVITHQLNTESRPMLGIQVALSKNGAIYEQSVLYYDVYSTETQTLLSHNEYLLSQGEDLQYVYLPFDNYEACLDEITISFRYENRDDSSVKAPSLIANARQLTTGKTLVDQRIIEGNIKCMYIYTHNTYPLVYDLRIILLVFLAASMSASWKIPALKKEKNHEK